MSAAEADMGTGGLTETGAGARASDDAPAHPAWLVCRAVLLENVRRRDFYVLLLLTGLFALGAIGARMLGKGDPAAAAFALNLGLTLAAGFGKLMTLLTCVRQHPGEVESGTIYPLMAKPLGRGHYLLGKMSAAFVTGVVTTAALGIIAWMASPALPATYAGTLAQAVALHGVGLASLAAVGTGASLVLPRAVNMVGLILLVAQGGTLLGYVRAKAAAGAGWAAAAQWPAAYIPDFSRFDLVAAYTDGAPPLSLAAFATRLNYGAAVAAGFAALAYLWFRRRPLL